jgi:hypothetical protein
MIIKENGNLQGVMNNHEHNYDDCVWCKKQQKEIRLIPIVSGP